MNKRPAVHPAAACIALVCFLFFSCASSPAAGDEEATDSSTTVPQALTAPGTPLAVPSKDQLKKNALDGQTLALLQTGSPQSIREAVRQINADSRGMTDQNRSALFLAAELMRSLYPYETIDWPIPAIADGDPYAAIIRSAKMGTYEYSRDSDDFFALVLPSLILPLTSAQGSWYQDAQASLLRASRQNDQSVLPPLFLAMLSERQNKTDIALSFYRKAWDIDDSCYPAGMALSRLFIAQGDGASALSVAQTLSVRYPSQIAITRLCAESAFVLRDWAMADSYILAVLKAEPGNTGYLLLRARILIERKEYLKANSLLDAFATQSRTDKTYLLLRSRVSREWNRNPVAATAFLQDALRLYPEDIDVLLSGAEVAYLTGQTVHQKTGRELVRMVLAREKENRVALTLLLDDYLASGEWPLAVTLADQLVALDGSTESRLRLARALLGSGSVPRAISQTSALYAANPANESVVSLHLRALVASGNLEGARIVISERMPSAASSLKSTLHYYESRLLSDQDAQLSSLRSSLLADPRNDLALFAMYEWYFERSDYRKAQYYLKQVIALDPMNRRYSRLLAELDDLLAR